MQPLVAVSVHDGWQCRWHSACTCVPASNLAVRKSVNIYTHTTVLRLSMDFVRDNPGEPVPEETFTHSVGMLYDD